MPIYPTPEQVRERIAAACIDAYAELCARCRQALHLPSIGIVRVDVPQFTTREDLEAVCTELRELGWVVHHTFDRGAITTEDELIIIQLPELATHGEVKA